MKTVTVELPEAIAHFVTHIRDIYETGRPGIVFPQTSKITPEKAKLIGAIFQAAVKLAEGDE